MIVGEPGIGKTRLGKELSNLAAAANALVLFVFASHAHRARGSPLVGRKFPQTAGSSIP